MKPINLNHARMARAKAQAKAKADENAVRFGRTGAEKRLAMTKAQKAESKLEAHRREDR